MDTDRTSQQADPVAGAGLPGQAITAGLRDTGAGVLIAAAAIHLDLYQTGQYESEMDTSMTRQTTIAGPPARTMQPAIADGAPASAGPSSGEARGAPNLTADRRPPAASRVTVDRNDHVAAAAYLMRHHGVTALAVLDGNSSTRPIGMITKTDITQALADGEDLNKVRISQLMSQSPGSDQPQLA